MSVTSPLQYGYLAGEDASDPLQRALDACRDGCTLEIPSGEYRITKPLVRLGVQIHVRAYGATLIYEGGDGTVLTLGGSDGRTRGGTVHGLNIRPYPVWWKSSAKVTGLKIQNVYWWSIRDIDVSYCSVNVELNKFEYGHFEPLNVSSGQTCLKLVDSGCNRIIGGNYSVLAESQTTPVDIMSFNNSGGNYIQSPALQCGRGGPDLRYIYCDKLSMWNKFDWPYIESVDHTPGVVQFDNPSGVNELRTYPQPMKTVSPFVISNWHLVNRGSANRVIMY